MKYPLLFVFSFVVACSNSSLNKESNKTLSPDLNVHDLNDTANVVIIRTLAYTDSAGIYRDSSYYEEENHFDRSGNETMYIAYGDSHETRFKQIWEYDHDGRKRKFYQYWIDTTVIDQYGLYYYDDFDRLIREEFFSKDSALLNVVHDQYDSLGRCIMQKIELVNDQGGVEVPGTRLFTYDANGQVVRTQWTPDSFGSKWDDTIAISVTGDTMFSYPTKSKPQQGDITVYLKRDSRGSWIIARRVENLRHGKQRISEIKREIEYY